MFFRSVLTALVALAASVSLAGPVRLATNFFIPAGRTNPVILDAKVDASGNLVTAAQADFGSGKQIVITKFTAAGVRRWSSTINTPVPVSAPGQVAGKFQIMLDGSGNTYVLSPRAGNPDYPGSSDDLLLRKINDGGATAGYLSLVRNLADRSGKVFSVKAGQMQATRTNLTDLGLVVTAVGTDGLSSAFLLRLDGSVSGSSLNVTGFTSIDGNIQDDGRYKYTYNYAAVGLTPGGTPAAPRMRLVVSQESQLESYFESYGYRNSWVYCFEVDVDSWTTIVSEDGNSTFLGEGHGFQAEGLGSSEDQELCLVRDSGGTGYIAWLGSLFENRELFTTSSVPYSATRVGSDWLVYGEQGGEYLLKYPASNSDPLGLYFISPEISYAGSSLVSARGRAYLAGGPTVGGVQGMYSSFSSEGELVYSAGQNQPFTVTTSFVVPAANNRFWTIGKTSAGLQAVVLWREPDYFVGISTGYAFAAGSTVTVKAHLSTPAPAGGYTFNVSVSSNLQNAPRTVTVPAGASSATFTVKVKSTATAGSATVVARTNATYDINTAHTATFSIR